MIGSVLEMYARKNPILVLCQKLVLATALVSIIAEMDQLTLAKIAIAEISAAIPAPTLDWVLSAVP